MKKIFYAALVCLCLPLCLIVGPSCGDAGGGTNPTSNDNAVVTVFFEGDAVWCGTPFEDPTLWDIEIFVDDLSGPFSEKEYDFASEDEFFTNFDVEVPTSGMYTIMVEITPTSSTACLTCCSSMCFPVDSGEPTFEGTQTFSAGGYFHNINVSLTDCDCC